MHFEVISLDFPWKPSETDRHMNYWRQQKKKLSLLIALLMVCLLVDSCSSSANKQLAEDGVTQFHLQLDSGQYNAIYNGTDEKFRQVSSEKDFTLLLDAVHRKLGRVQNAELKNFQIGWYAGQGQTVTLIYHTQFAEGRADERFVWHISGGQPLLVGYNINSNDLITR